MKTDCLTDLNDEVPRERFLQQTVFLHRINLKNKKKAHATTQMERNKKLTYTSITYN